MNKKNKHTEQEDEMILENELEYNEELSLQDKIKKLRKKLKECEKEKQDNLAGWQRQKADAVNEKKRLLLDMEKAKKIATIRLVEAFLPALDSFDSALKGDAWDKLDETWKSGMRFISKQFQEALESLGAENFANEKDEFNPQIHEIIKERSADKKELDHKIATVLRKGYRTKDGQTIRPAQVEIFKYKSKND